MKNPPRSFDFRTSRDIEDIKVELWDAQLPMDAARVISSFYMSTWGDPINPGEWDDDRAWALAQDACDGKVLPNTLEAIALTFSMQGLSRATTHQMVRTRVGAVFGQQGGRDNNWSNFNIRIPETFWDRGGTLVGMAEDLQIFADKVYRAALEAGVPFQDARYVLPMGLETALVGSYNLLSIKSLADRRLCNRMMWETNYIVRIMSDLAVLQYPFLGRNLRSSCEKRGVCGSVSPMFPPACITYGMNEEGVRGITTARDNQTLSEMTAGVYDFPLTANGCWLHFNEIDIKRLETERLSPDVVLSLLDGQTVLAFKDSKGLWRNEG